MQQPQGISYDDVPYESHAFAQTQPDRLAVLARLFSLESVLPSRARVLEIGCATGGNLIPLACRYPAAQFTGIDRSRRQAEEGQRHAAALGLGNLKLIEMDLMAVDESFGKFDYIIAHGVYSWIPPSARQKLLAVCRANLSETGIAYVSYNTLPGWHFRGAIRDMMRYHVGQAGDAPQRAAQARAMLEFIKSSLAEDNGAYAAMLREESRFLGKFTDSDLLHDHLEEDNAPVYFHEFVTQAAAAGLQYLCEEEIAMSMPGLMFKPDVVATLGRIAPDMVRSEQYSDFLKNRMFRQSVLVGASRAPQRAMRAELVTGLQVSSRARAESGNTDFRAVAAETFVEDGGGSASVASPVTKAALHVLQGCWPEALPFAELLERARGALGKEAADPADALQLASDLLTLAPTTIARLHCEPVIATGQVSEKPAAFLAARHYAALGKRRLPNARHETLQFDLFTVNLLPLLDGTRDRAALVDAMVDRISSGKLAPKDIGEPVDEAKSVRERVTDSIARVLVQFKDNSLLVG